MQNISIYYQMNRVEGVGNEVNAKLWVHEFLISYEQIGIFLKLKSRFDFQFEDA